MAEKRTVMVLCYWGLNDVLTASTALPHAEILKTINSIGRIVFVTVERSDSGSVGSKPGAKDKDFVFRQLKSKSYRPNLVNKINDFILFPKQLKKIVEEERVDSIVAVGTPAGALALLVNSKIKVPFYVAFYEPHAAYMLETGVWSRYDPRYLFQARWDRKQAQVAEGLITVSEKYRDKITVEEGIPADKVIAAPNGVQPDKFRYSEAFRRAIRSRVGIPANGTVGIYVGKFGGLYYDEEAFFIYKRCFEKFSNFYLIILSPQEKQQIIERLELERIDVGKVFVASVAHEDVANYLSAADFAFATIKTYPSARFCSPVKVGEYWANGLPVLLTEGVGDDSEIIDKEGGGATFSLKKEDSLEKALDKIKRILQDPDHRQQIARLAEKYRSYDRVREAYEYFFGKQKQVEAQ